MPRPWLSLVLPVYNQAEHIEAVAGGYADALEAMNAGDWEILLVTNGCTDDSVAVCKRLAEARPCIRLLELQESGWGRAVRAGIRNASGEVIGYTNSARTTPEMLTLMAAYARAYSGVVLKANRRIRDSLFRRAGSLIYNLETRALFDLSVWDINGTPKFFPREFEQLTDLSREDDLIDAEFNAICRYRDYPVVEVPILATQRHGGRSTTNIKSALRMYTRVV